MQPERLRQLAEIQSSVDEFLARTAGGQVQGAEVSDEKVIVRLAQNEVPLAEEVVRTFSNKVQVIVGFKTFPSGTTSVAGDISNVLRDARSEIPGMRLSFSPSQFTLPQGETGMAEIVVDNIGLDKCTGSIGSDLGWLRVPGTTEIVGGYSGWSTGTGRSLPQRIGDSVRIRFITGTASCQSGPDYSVPTGTYEVVVPLNVSILDQKQIVAAAGCIVVVQL